MPNKFSLSVFQRNLHWNFSSEMSSIEKDVWSIHASWHSFTCSSVQKTLLYSASLQRALNYSSKLVREWFEKKLYESHFYLFEQTQFLFKILNKLHKIFWTNCNASPKVSLKTSWDARDLKREKFSILVIKSREKQIKLFKLSRVVLSRLFNQDELFREKCFKKFLYYLAKWVKLISCLLRIIWKVFFLLIAILEIEILNFDFSNSFTML